LYQGKGEKSKVWFCLPAFSSVAGICKGKKSPAQLLFKNDDDDTVGAANFYP
jgi:hypothetical protein